MPLGNDMIRFTMRQNILLRNIPGQLLETLYTLLKDLGIETDLPRILNTIVACTGADTCRVGLCLSRGPSSALKKKLAPVCPKNNWMNSAICRSIFQDAPIPVVSMLYHRSVSNGKASRNDRLYPAYYVVAGGRTGDNQARLALKRGEISAPRPSRFYSTVCCRSGVRKKQGYRDFNDTWKKKVNPISPPCFPALRPSLHSMKIKTTTSTVVLLNYFSCRAKGPPNVQQECST
jgi:sulfite reductase (ferredoxin)